MRISNSRNRFESLGVLGVVMFVLFYLFMWVIGLCASIGIPVGIFWCIYHFIHNGYKW